MGWAIETGKLLIEQQKVVPKGDWLLWLGANCPEIGERTAQKYMKLANANHDSDTTLDLQTVRQAYLAAGIISEPEKVSSGPRAPDCLWTPLRKAIDWYTEDRVEELISGGEVTGLGMLRLVKESEAKLGRIKVKLIEKFGDVPYGQT